MGRIFFTGFFKPFKFYSMLSKIGTNIMPCEMCKIKHYPVQIMLCGTCTTKLFGWAKLVKQSVMPFKTCKANCYAALNL